MNLDLLTVTLLTALVVVVTSVVFIVGMLLRKDESAGRIWGLAFLAALLTVVSYLAWAASPEAWWAVAVGNAAFVGGTGLMWLGARRFNGAPMMLPVTAVAVVSAVALVVVLALGPDGGDWAGAEIMFVGILVFAGLGARECLYGEMGHHRESWGLAFVLGLQSVYYLVRTGAFFAYGPESDVFSTWFGTVETSFLTITLSIVAMVVTTVLLSGRLRLRGSVGAVTLELSNEGIMPESSFERILLDMSERAMPRGELVGVISVRVDDIRSIGTAFGSEAADIVLASLRDGVRRYAPIAAFIGQDSQNVLYVGIQPSSHDESRRIARRIRRGLFEELSGVVGAVIPIVGVSVVLSDVAGYDPASLMRAAKEASYMASTSIGTTDVFADA
ncbi:hypothetical protein [Microbacterium sp. RU33B]|uniref:hypothetical protein n=1 Tax=Microbacterium sp. RU33B TaxID=1907390 RepID=UPI000969C55D|nr:hypothetical protein [Microbacterium sp. RU33B]SIT76484.1 GGDEF domain-containing protein, diguanylate cyclase (c-di-GMP synthetase) or its enzymatically inactive variants [Microbacterium sp. RU33B]